MQNKTIEIIIDLTSVVLKQRGEIKKLKERIKELVGESNTLYSKLKEEESKPCPTHDNLQYALLTEQEENGKLRETIERLRNTIACKNDRIVQLEMQASGAKLAIESDTDDEHRFKVDTPLGEETTAFSEGDEVIVDGRYINDISCSYIGKIVKVHDDYALINVELARLDMPYEIPNKYLTHLIESENNA